MLVIDLTLPVDQLRSQLHHWIVLLRSRMPDARGSTGRYRVLLAGAKTDSIEHSEQLQLKLSAVQPVFQDERLGLVELTVFSSMTGDGVSALIRRIRQSAQIVLNTAAAVPKYVWWRWW